MHQGVQTTEHQTRDSTSSGTILQSLHEGALYSRARRATRTKASGCITSSSSSPPPSTFMEALSSRHSAKRRDTWRSSIESPLSPSSAAIMVRNSARSSTPSPLSSCFTKMLRRSFSMASAVASHVSLKSSSHSCSRTCPPSRRDIWIMESSSMKGKLPKPYLVHAWCVASMARLASMSGFFVDACPMFSLILGIWKRRPKAKRIKLLRSSCQQAWGMMPDMCPKTRMREPASLSQDFTWMPIMSEARLLNAMLLSPNLLIIQSRKNSG
mmetsp:Transcript_51875/g.83789  ORF Transcript_51875/g.83789 Transcript_51875/m.83789 type:complete len:269 (-) Transcript_51875:2201-3007(-)